uniref:Protein disulfideisomerase A4like [Apis florea] n=1 Tax=Lepeophtheirus salmonis TaxID=72036 RepID=A0A0K2UE52_LEPSM
MVQLMRAFKSFPLILCVLFGVVYGELEQISNKSELVKLTEQEEYVVVLFGGDTEETLENELSAIREDLVDSLNAWVVKLEDDDLKKEIDPHVGSDSMIVFYRKGVPVIYKGAASDEELLETLIAHKDKCSRDLTDTSFEHLTQAATGATTGDWFVLFFKEDLAESVSLFPRMETLACLHRGRINIGNVNRGSTGAVTGRRFNVDAVPSIILFRLGRMYRYDSDKFDIDSMSKFITEIYKEKKGESIPMPKSAFDDLVQLCVDLLKENPFMCLAVIAIPLIIIISFIYLTKSEEPKAKKKKKKKDT